MDMAPSASRPISGISQCGDGISTAASRIAAATKRKLSSFEKVDIFLLFLRLLTIAGAAVFYLFTAENYSAHHLFVIFFPTYLLYSAVLYACIFLRPQAVKTIYLLALVLDMLFVSALILFVGLFVGSFFIAFYLIVGIHSYYFGLRVGLAASLAASLLYGYSFVLLDGNSLIPWPDFLVRIVFLFLVAGSFGFLAEKEKKEKRLLADALDAASASIEVKDRFLASLSHEIRTPVTVITGHSEALCSGVYGCLDSEQIKPLENIRKSATHLVELLDHLVKLSRLKAGDIRIRTQPIDVNYLVRDIVEDFRLRNRQVSLELTLPPYPVTAESDQLLLRQVISNLVTNAVKFTQEGCVHVSLLNGDSAEEAVKVVVEDTGIGISTEEIPLIFDDFFKGRDPISEFEPGLGLGLAIVKRSLALLGGQIRVESAWGKGSRFVVSLPKQINDASSIGQHRSSSHEIGVFDYLTRA